MTYVVPAETHSRQEATPDEIRRTVLDNAAEILGVDPDQIGVDTALPDDTVAIVELVDLCREDLAERTVDAELEETALEWKTVGDVIAFFLSDEIAGDGAGSPAGAGTGDSPGEPAVPLAQLESALGHEFSDKAWLHAALRHRSYVAEMVDVESNERLEFLGDAVLSIVVTDCLFRTWPDKAEGPLAKARAAVVSAEYLAGLAARLGLGAHVRLGRGEDASGGREKPSILADAMEAVIGAVYLDGGLEAAERVVMPLVEERLAEAVTGEGAKDHKTRLQEYSSARWATLPRYEVQGFGPDHAKEFTATVEVGGRVVGKGHGRSKKQAEQAAARNAWTEVRGRKDPRRSDLGEAEADEP